MLNQLTDQEYSLLNLIIQGETCYSILEWLGVDYITYCSLKKSLLKKFGVKRITELFCCVLEIVKSEDFI